MDCRPPGPSIRGVSQPRILERAAIFYARELSWLREWTHVSWVSCIGRWILYHWCYLGSLVINSYHPHFLNFLNWNLIFLWNIWWRMCFTSLKCSHCLKSHDGLTWVNQTGELWAPLGARQSSGIWGEMCSDASHLLDTLPLAGVGGDWVGHPELVPAFPPPWWLQLPRGIWTPQSRVPLCHRLSQTEVEPPLVAWGQLYMRQLGVTLTTEKVRGLGKCTGAVSQGGRWASGGGGGAAAQWVRNRWGRWIQHLVIVHPSLHPSNPCRTVPKMRPGLRSRWGCSGKCPQSSFLIMC